MSRKALLGMTGLKVLYHPALFTKRLNKLKLFPDKARTAGRPDGYDSSFHPFAVSTHRHCRSAFLLR